MMQQDHTVKVQLLSPVERIRLECIHSKSDRSELIITEGLLEFSKSRLVGNRSWT
jgi:hypothetical protein